MRPLTFVPFENSDFMSHHWLFCAFIAMTEFPGNAVQPSMPGQVFRALDIFKQSFEGDLLRQTV